MNTRIAKHLDLFVLLCNTNMTTNDRKIFDNEYKRLYDYETTGIQKRLKTVLKKSMVSWDDAFAEYLNLLRRLILIETAGQLHGDPGYRLNEIWKQIVDRDLESGISIADFLLHK